MLVLEALLQMKSAQGPTILTRNHSESLRSGERKCAWMNLFDEVLL